MGGRPHSLLSLESFPKIPPPPVRLIVMLNSGTFTKSFGSCGGYIAGSSDLIRFLKCHSPAHLYAASISPAASQQILSAIKLINGEDGTTRGMDKVIKSYECAILCLPVICHTLCELIIRDLWHQELHGITRHSTKFATLYFSLAFTD